MDESILSSDLPIYYQLCAKYGQDHAFRTVGEIIDALPAVCKFIFAGDRFSVSEYEVKSMERLEIMEIVSIRFEKADEMQARDFGFRIRDPT